MLNQAHKFQESQKSRVILWWYLFGLKETSEGSVSPWSKRSLWWQGWYIKQFSPYLHRKIDKLEVPVCLTYRAKAFALEALAGIKWIAAWSTAVLGDISSDHITSQCSILVKGIRVYRGSSLQQHLLNSLGWVAQRPSSLPAYRTLPPRPNCSSLQALECQTEQSGESFLSKPKRGSKPAKHTVTKHINKTVKVWYMFLPDSRRINRV